MRTNVMRLLMLLLLIGEHRSWFPFPATTQNVSATIVKQIDTRPIVFTYDPGFI
jgi:hypothetical protein